MTIVKINALAIPPQAGDEIVGRFAARLDELATVPGFEGFELLKPTGDNETRWFVYTRWADESAYEAWRNGDTFARNHGGSDSSSESAEEREKTSDSAGGARLPGRPSGGPPPLATGATLLEFEVMITAERTPPAR